MAGGGREAGTKERLNYEILATVLNGKFVFDLRFGFREHKRGIQDLPFFVSMSTT